MHQQTALTDLAAIFPTLAFDLKYATADNITGYAIYAEARALLHPDAVSALAKSIAIARLAGFTLLIFDAYRPPQAQYHLWQACPDLAYVVPPEQGSNHSRGVAIDLTLLDETGRPLEMGSAFDAMEDLSHAFHPDVPQQALRNRLMLNAIMLGGGFVGMATEWWHFELPMAQHYPVTDAGLICTRRISSR